MKRKEKKKKRVRREKKKTEEEGNPRKGRVGGTKEKKTKDERK